MSLQTDRLGPVTFCPASVRDGTVIHGMGPTFLGVYYIVGPPYWEGVHCTKCQRLLRWATDAESPINAALRANGQTEPALP